MQGSYIPLILISILDQQEITVTAHTVFLSNDYYGGHDHGSGTGANNDKSYALFFVSY